jgi:hypothetical protein
MNAGTQNLRWNVSVRMPSNTQSIREAIREQRPSIQNAKDSDWSKVSSIA